MSEELVFFGKFRIKKKDGTDEYTVSAEPFSDNEKDALAGIVRCRDCKWFDFDICACKRRPLHMAVEPDGFCAWGERKEVDA